MNWQAYETKRRNNNETAAALLDLHLSGKTVPPALVDAWMEDRRQLQDQQATYEDQVVRELRATV